MLNDKLDVFVEFQGMRTVAAEHRAPAGLNRSAAGGGLRPENKLLEHAVQAGCAGCEETS